MSEPFDLVVRAGNCPCPGAPHQEEHVYLQRELTLAMVGGALGALRGSTNIPEMEGRLIQGFFPVAITGWTFVDKDGDLIAPTADAMEELLPIEQGGFELVEFAREHYMPRIGRFLAVRTSTLSQPGPTDDSTSASPPSGSPLPEPSKPSSLNGGAGRRSAAPAR